jgi:hypothetical protein
MQAAAEGVCMTSVVKELIQEALAAAVQERVMDRLEIMELMDLAVAAVEELIQIHQEALVAQGL